MCILYNNQATNQSESFDFYKYRSVSREREKQEREMEEGKGEVKHILLAKFKEGISEQQIDDYIKEYANLVNLVPSMKAFRWGKDVSIENLHQGFTHVFESTFESTDGIAEYIVHPDHVEYGNKLLAQLEKVLVVDFKPTKVHL